VNPIRRNPFDENEADDDPRLAAALHEYVTAIESGNPINRRDFVSQYPEIADELGRCLDGLAFVQAAAGEIPGAPPAPKRRTEIDPSMSQPIGDFQLVQEIGYGGMGTVYEAVQLSLGRRVAVKVLPMAAALDARHLERFHLEAQAAARLHHSNIVPVYAVGCERSVHFYAMQLIDGDSLAEVIRDLRSLAQRHSNVKDLSAGGRTIDKTSQDLSVLRTNGGPAYAHSVAKLAVQAADALAYAHDAGVVHRDIKPANLLLDAGGKLWITDFGLAQLYAESDLTRSGDMVGTLRYMSPEQASGRAVVLDQRTDIYSLGVTLYELLTLQCALPGTTHGELLHQLANYQPHSPRSIDRTIPPELDTVLTKAIAKDPADRYPTAGALAEDLRRFLRDEPILARPPSLREKSVKWVRRHKSLAAATFFVLALATLGFSISTVLIARQQEQTQIAYELEKQKAIEADQMRVRAEKSDRQARQAVEFFSRIASDEMDRPAFAEIRREMLEESLAYFENFMEERSPTTSASVELDSARARASRYLELFSSLDANMRSTARVRLLSERSVQRELNLSPAQADQISQAVWDAASSLPSPTATSVPQIWPQQRAQENIARKQQIDAALTRELGPKKAERLEQIQRQVVGPPAFNEPEVIEQLDLSQEQRMKIRAIIAQFRNARMPPGPEGDPGGDVEDLKSESIANIRAVLTPSQVQTWNSLIGPPFTGPVRSGGPGDGSRPPPPPERPDDRPPGPG